MAKRTVRSTYITFIVASTALMLVSYILGGAALLTQSFQQYIVGATISTILLFALFILRRAGVGKKSKLINRLVG